MYSTQYSKSFEEQSAIYPGERQFTETTSQLYPSQVGILNINRATINYLNGNSVKDIVLKGTQTLDDLSDATISNPTDKQVLTYETTSSQWKNKSTILDDLTDVAAPTPSTNDVLVYNGTNWVNNNTIVNKKLDDLTDVVAPTPSTNDVLAYNGTNWVNNAPSLSNLSGVAISTPVAGDIMTYNSTLGKWINKQKEFIYIKTTVNSAVGGAPGNGAFIYGTPVVENKTAGISTTTGVGGLTIIGFQNTSGRTLNIVGQLTTCVQKNNVVGTVFYDIGGTISPAGIIASSFGVNEIKQLYGMFHISLPNNGTLKIVTYCIDGTAIIFTAGANPTVLYAFEV